MTPDIRPFLLRVIELRPQRWAENTYQSCAEILTLTLSLAGPEWAFVGKTADADGRSEQPPGFVPFDVSLMRPDGQSQTIRIVGVSHDAAWHVPSGRQVKVIVNSAANSDDRPEIHGPARIGGDVIPVADYRWHNPPVPQTNSGPQPVPMPGPPPAPSAQPPGREEALSELQWLHGYYMAADGLQRPRGLWRDDTVPPGPDFEGIAAWFIEIYQRERMAGKSPAGARIAYVTQIRQSAEWRERHPGETP